MPRFGYRRRRRVAARTRLVRRRRPTVRRLALAVRALRPELKWFDTERNPSNIGDTTTANKFVDNMCNIAQGGGSSNRDGNQIAIHSVMIQLMTTSVAAGLTTQRVNYALVIWKRPVAGSVPSITDVFKVSTGGQNTDGAYLRELANIGDYRVLRSGQIVMDSADTGGNPHSAKRTVSVHFRMPLRVRWNGATAANLNMNQLVFMLWSNDANGTPANLPIAAYISRIRFTDV